MANVTKPTPVRPTTGGVKPARDVARRMANNARRAATRKTPASSASPAMDARAMATKAMGASESQVASAMKGMSAADKAKAMSSAMGAGMSRGQVMKAYNAKMKSGGSRSPSPVPAPGRTVKGGSLVGDLKSVSGLNQVMNQVDKIRKVTGGNIDMGKYPMGVASSVVRGIKKLF